MVSHIFPAIGTLLLFQQVVVRHLHHHGGVHLNGIHSFHIQLAKAPRVAFFLGNPGVSEKVLDDGRYHGPAHGSPGSCEKDRTGMDPLFFDIAKQLLPHIGWNPQDLSDPVGICDNLPVSDCLNSHVRQFLHLDSYGGKHLDEQVELFLILLLCRGEEPEIFRAANL